MSDIADMSNKRNVVLYIACSIDGYIASPEGDIEFLSKVEKEGEDYGYNDFISTIDTVIMGRKTYDKVLSFGIPYPHAEKYSYIISKQPFESKPNLEFYGGSLSMLVLKIKQKEGGDIFVDGGSEMVFQMINEDLIDKMVISTIPVLLGDGIPLFKSGMPGSDWKLEYSRSYESGLVQNCYKRKRHV